MNGDKITYRRFALQAAVLAWAAIIVFWSFYAFDHFTSPGAPHAGGLWTPFQRYFDFDPVAINNPLSSLPGVNAAVFGIVITVVSIIVQLTAERYTGVARMFVRDPINIIITAYFVVACVVSVWLSGSLRTEYVPQSTVAMVLSLSTGSLVVMAPYFSYVFWFLEPRNIVSRIRRDAIARADKGAHEEDQTDCFKAQAETLFALEELTDIANNSISGKDKIIASASVDALKDFAVEYLKVKPRATAAWFSIGPGIRQNPDFVAMDPESVIDLEERHTWVEWKVMRQFLSIYNEALESMRDINYVVAIDTRYIGEAAAKAGDDELIDLTIRFMNSYLRATLNANDVRTTYNVLNQYRKLVESLILEGKTKSAVAGVKHMKYYGLLALDMGLTFITETVGYDIAAIAETANEAKSPAENDILAEFLGLDRPPYVDGSERALLGVRKAQVKLAAYYVSTNQEDRARKIANDMRDEPKDRLQKVRRQLENVENKDFWEIIDRGRNFEFMPAPQRACLATFFGWLDVAA